MIGQETSHRSNALLIVGEIDPSDVLGESSKRFFFGDDGDEKDGLAPLPRTGTGRAAGVEFLDPSFFGEVREDRSQSRVAPIAATEVLQEHGSGSGASEIEDSEEAGPFASRRESGLMCCLHRPYYNTYAKGVVKM